MVFWIAVAMLAAAVTYAVTRPLMRPLHPETDTAASAGQDLSVYKDQLAEIESDAARGILSPSDAESARAEVARRVLRLSETAKAKAAPAVMANFIRPVAGATTVVLPVASLALYLVFGAPGMPGLPLSERLAARIDTSRTDDLIAKVEARLRDHPEDGKGWDVIAPVYLRQGRHAEAADAFAKSMTILGESPERLQGFASARIRAENGIVPDDARKALQSLTAAHPDLKQPRIWLALAKEQDGKVNEAVADYKALIAEAPEGAPWKGFLQQRVDQMTGVAPAAAGPDADQVKAVQSMSDGDRQAFITRMVEGLAERLKTNAKDKEGWLKLIRSYQMLGRKDDAVKALAGAKAGLAGDAAALSEVEGLAKQLGVGG